MVKRFRILSVSNCPLERSLGSGAMVLAYADGFRERGHEVTVLGPEHYELLPRIRAGKRLRTLVGYARATRRLVASAPYDVVELWGAEAWWIMQRLARRKPRPLLVARSNGLEPHLDGALTRQRVATKKTPLARAFDRWQRRDLAFRCADLLTVVSEFDREFAVAHRYQPPDRLITLENPLPEGWLNQPLPSNRPRVVTFVGSGIPNKGAALLVRAAVPMLRANPDWSLRVVGVGTLQLESHLPPTLMNRMRVIPFESDREQLRTLYRTSSVVAMPSVYESFGLVATEAMACGCLLLSSPTGFAASLRDNIEAIIVRERSESAWAQALLDAVADDAQREAISRRGHARVQELRWQPTVARLEAAYAAAAMS